MKSINKEEKEILKELQSHFPVEVKPYQVIADQLGMKEEVVLAKVKELKSKGIIRRLGAVFASKELGYQSVLIALKVAEKNIEGIAAYINSFDNVTHNYLRDDPYNIWFTFSGKTKKEINDFTEELKNNKRIDSVLVLPATKMVKLNAVFNF